MKALRTVKETLKSSPTDLQSNFEICKIYYKLKEYPQALESCHRASQLLGSNPELKEITAKSLYKQGRYQEAYSELLDMSKSFQCNSKIFHIFGTVCRRLGRDKEGISYLKECLNHPISGNERAQVYCELGSAWINLSEYVQAVQMFTEALKTSNDPRIIGCLSWGYIKTGEIEKAISHISSTEILPDDELYNKVKYLLAVCYTQLSRLSDALSIMQQLISKDRNVYELWCSCGIIYALAKQYDDAFQCFIKGKSINKDRWEVWFNLGCMYEIADQVNDSHTAFQQAQVIYCACSELERNFVQPQFDIYDYFFGGQKIVNKVESKRGLQVLRESSSTKDKRAPMEPLVGLPQVPVSSSITLGFMKTLVNYCKSMAQPNLNLTK